MSKKIDTKNRYPNRRDDNADMEILSKQDKQVINEYLDSF